MLKDRDDHLDEVFGIKVKQTNDTVENIVPADHLIEQDKRVVVTEPRSVSNSVTVNDSSNDNNELKKSLEDNISKLDIMYTSLDSVLAAHTEVCVEFNKGRDVESVAALAKAMTDLIKESRETKMKMFEKPKMDKAEPQGQTNIANQQVIQVGSMRELNSLLALQKKNNE